MSEIQEQMEQAIQEQLASDAESRRFIYKDVEELITTGFLSQEAYFGETLVVFRTLLPWDFRRIQARAGLRSIGDLNYLRWCLASSIWIVDGFEMPLQSEHNGPYHLYKKWIAHIPSIQVPDYASILIALRNRLNTAIKLVEAYCYETYSRQLWKSLGCTKKGLEGANIVRRMWILHNITEDESIRETQRWAHTRMVVGSMSGKGAKEISRVLEQEKNKEKTARLKHISKTLSWVIDGDQPSTQGVTVTINGKEITVPKIQTPHTVTELQEEMRKIFAGELDLHDSVVEGYHNQIRSLAEKKDEAIREAYAKAQQEAESRATEPSTPLVGYTEEQLLSLNPDLNKRKGTGTMQKNTSGKYLYDRYVSRKIEPGVLTPSLEVTSKAEDQRKSKPLQERLEDRLKNRRG